jgi:serine/threonine protein kinase
MTQQEAATVMSHVCYALMRMHQLGFVYGDLQPGNVVSAQLPGEPDCAWHLLDIASLVQLKEGEQFKPHQECGTAAYRAPERREGHKFNSLEKRQMCTAWACCCSSCVQVSVPGNNLFVWGMPAVVLALCWFFVVSLRRQDITELLRSSWRQLSSCGQDGV